MSRPALGERITTAEELRSYWPTLLREVKAFADAAPDGSASRLGRLEVFAHLFTWPEEVARHAQREREREQMQAERAANADNGHRPVAALRR